MRADLNALAVFSIVAEVRSFQAAADRLGITRSAVSQSVRRLEEALCVALVRRTTRSMSLTEAGERLRLDTGPAIAKVQTALEEARDLGTTVRGQLRLAVSSIAETVLSGRLLADFTHAHPEVQIDVLVTDEQFDIVAAGFDAGIRLGEVIEQDMVAVPVSSDQRQLAVCAPAYLDGRSPPLHPAELAAHRCVGWRPAPRTVPYRWEFAEEGRDFAVAVEPEITTNDMGLMIRLAVAGAGITFGMEETFRRHLDSGELVPLLEDFSPGFPGFFVYYPSRRNMEPKLRAFIDHIRGNRHR